MSVTTAIVTDMGETRPIDTLNTYDYDALWAAADLPNRERAAWREAFAHRTKLPDDAVAYCKAGLTPQELMAARTEPQTYWPAHTTGEDLDSDALDRLALLATETARFHAGQATLAREVRQQYIMRLTERGRSHESIGAPLGLSRQRVRAIVKGAPDSA